MSYKIRITDDPVKTNIDPDVEKEIREKVVKWYESIRHRINPKPKPITWNDLGDNPDIDDLEMDDDLGDK